MAPATPMTTPHGSATATSLAHPMSPTATDILSKSLFRTWSERVVAASLDLCSKIILVVKTGAGKSHLMRTTGILLGGVCLIVFVRIRFKNPVLMRMHDRDRDAPPLNQ
eukprot:scaffold553801_cov63-Attheya_sp.AAC.2